MGLLSSDVEAVVIELDKANQPIVAGETVTGAVLVTTQKSGVKVQSITLEVTGEIDIEFEKKIKKKNTKLKQHVMFFKHSIVLEGEEKELAVGMSKYNFSFDLPKDGKSSFEGKYGKLQFQNERIYFETSLFSCRQYKVQGRSSCRYPLGN